VDSGRQTVVGGSVAPIPELGTYALMAAGVVGVVARRRRAQERRVFLCNEEGARGRPVC
jgi:hypothetical protein